MKKAMDGSGVVVWLCMLDISRSHWYIAGDVKDSASHNVVPRVGMVNGDLYTGCKLLPYYSSTK
jgi:hypothetical protein